LAERGFTVLGLPCNQFGAQEPGTDAEVLEFATSNYGVTFPLFSKIEVNGDGACELYQWLTTTLPKADGGGAIGWNFTKFLVGRDGQPLERFEPQVTPENIGTRLAQLL
jgi:glutathione peroxidase